MVTQLYLGARDISIAKGNLPSIPSLLMSSWACKLCPLKVEDLLSLLTHVRALPYPHN